MKKTKIIATVGPACSSQAVLAKMHRAGMNAVRINVAHGTFEEYDAYLEAVRAVGEIPIIVDIKGPEVRVRCSKPLAFKAGEFFEAGFAPHHDPYFTYNFLRDVKVGDRVLFNNGLFETQILEKKHDSVVLLANVDGIIEDRKGVNIPGARLKPPELSPKDRKAIEWARKNEVEFIALSFTRSADDVRRLRSLLKYNAAILAKIENQEGVSNMDDIIRAADGVIVARGDLGVELPHAKIPMIQKRILQRCNEHAKLAITATQMLESMITNPTPTRAETSDVANAIFDGSDALMLSGETAVGRYPVKAVEAIAAIAREVEPFVLPTAKPGVGGGLARAVSTAASHILSDIAITKVVCITRTGYSARAVSAFKPKQEILAVTTEPLVKRQLELSYGVTPFHCPELISGDRIITAAKFLLDKEVLLPSDRVVFIAAFHTLRMHESNLIEVHDIAELKDFFSHREVVQNL
ncbi:MAG: pyruvate kinase [Candidatus Micrarchaeia archaeon]